MDPVSIRRIHMDRVQIVFGEGINAVQIILEDAQWTDLQLAILSNLQNDVRTASIERILKKANSQCPCAEADLAGVCTMCGKQIAVDLTKDFTDPAKGN
jgi:hypothetical protein